VSGERILVDPSSYEEIEIDGFTVRTLKPDVVRKLRHQGYERIPGFEPLGPPVPGNGPIEGLRQWNGRLYAARGGCIWALIEGDWCLADGETLPPSFPPRKEVQHVEE
jgi:hypothetical protein